MPYYDFKCNSCGALAEDVKSSIAGTETFTCLECGSAEVIRLVCKTTFKLKGSGWANDSYTK